MSPILSSGEGRPPRPGGSFDTGKLDTLMEEAGFEILLVTSKHCVGYRFFDGTRDAPDGGRGWTAADPAEARRKQQSNMPQEHV